MRPIRRALGVALTAAALTACHAEDTTPAPTSVTVTVNDGYGGGTFRPGTTIHVWSGVDPRRGLTTGWMGGDGMLTEWNGDFVVPHEDVTIAPVIVTAPVTLVQRTYTLSAGARSVLGDFPAHPVGLVLFFHGAQFSVDQLRDNAATTIAIALVRAGYAVVAVPSEMETANGVGGWNPDLTGNTDLDNVAALIDKLTADGSVPKSAPVIAWGMSSGGFFAHTVGAALPADVVVAYCSQGTPEANAKTHARTAFYVAADDQTIPTSIADSASFQKKLASRGIETDRYVHPPTPLYDQRFLRVAGVDAQRSATIAGSLLAHGDVDPKGHWLVTGSSITTSLALDGLDGLSAAQKAAVGEEIAIMAADHELYDDVANRMVAFVVGP